ncbi:interferon-induced protein with tetratricopeptide repeat 2-like protein [Willisornis vidua]|uniref:Interferon-induced protein with tetratricopeptide repeat 2-like protein n=1 Tax=Willisornis vidua TaxID=1566151 RepID=A0ABQ9DL36_9PASS|nr:interferon-induced protein with tetratricopeptide repeat 2-like protein [Willisornis vidua]
MSKEQLKEKLERLQCHFTWQLGVVAFYNPSHVLQKLAVEIKHTTNQNQVALLGLQAYLHQLNNQSREALQSLRAAEKLNRGEREKAATAGSLVIQGNYAWIYFLQGSDLEAKESLAQAQQLWDAQLIPYMQAQKGWSLLAIRTGHGERARECFETALMADPENSHFQAGLAKALYFSWSYFQYHDTASQARRHLETTVREQPNNYRAKAYLARLIEQVDKIKPVALLEECAEKSSDPEVLKSSALSWLPQSVEQAVKIIQKVLQQDPGYHLLYQALAKCYKIQWVNAEEQDKENILDKAIKQLKEIVQKHPDLDLTLVRLQLAEFIGVRDPAQEEEIYKDLEKKVDTMSLRCRQALNLSWGKFLLYQKRREDEAKAKFMEGYKIPAHTEQRKECLGRLKKMAWLHQDRGDTDSAAAIHDFLRDTKQGLPGELSRLSIH